MSARIDVINYGLTILGEDSITAPSLESGKGETAVIRAMRNIYFIARNAVLEEAEWTFATRRFKPAVSSVAPEWGWAFAYPIPSDIVRVTQVDRNGLWFPTISDSQMESNPVPHEVEYVVGIGGKGMAIVCDEEEIFCKGIREIEDEGIYSPLFVEALGCKLAYLAGFALPESRTKLEVALALYTDAIKKAKTRDGMQNTTRRMRNRSSSRAR